MTDVDYSAAPPADYRCHQCNATGIKLWRGYSSGHVELTCVDCTEAGEGRKCTWITAEGVAWWHRLPLRPKGGA